MIPVYSSGSRWNKFSVHGFDGKHGNFLSDEGVVESKHKFEGGHSGLTGKIIGAFFQIQKELGFGFSEKVYEGALEALLLKMGFQVARQQDINVYYHSKVVGELKAD